MSYATDIVSLPGWYNGKTLDNRAGGRGFDPRSIAKQRIKFLGLLYVSRPEWDYKRSLVSLVAQIGNQWLAAGGNPVGAAI